MTYRLIDKFEGVFSGKPYLHRVSTHGDSVAMEMFEDIYKLGRSLKFNRRIDAGLSVLSTKNIRQGVKARRGDGTFGEIVPNIPAVKDVGFSVQRSDIATIEIGIEVKILAKAMIKQIDRVVSDLDKQVTHFKSKGGNPITVGIVGVNWATAYCSFEGNRLWPTDGKRYKHPIQESADAEQRLLSRTASHFDEFVILPFIASNQSPFPFAWKNKKLTEREYGAALARISAEYERRN